MPSLTPIRIYNNFSSRQPSIAMWSANDKLTRGIDVVFDVAFVANELMIDRLAQVCQKMLGRFGKLTSKFRCGRWLI